MNFKRLITRILFVLLLSCFVLNIFSTNLLEVSASHDTNYHLSIEQVAGCNEETLQPFVTPTTLQGVLKVNNHNPVQIAVGVPNLISPSSGSVINDNSPTLTWSGVPEAFQYRVELSTSSNFQSPQIAYPSNTYYTFAGLGNQRYYWRVCAIDIFHEYGDWSATWNFVVDTIPPGAPNLYSPSNGALTNDNTPTFIWSSVAGAYRYNLQVDDSSSFSSPAVNIETGTTSYTTTPLSDRTYYWRVRARDEAGNWGSWSVVFHMTIDTTPPGRPNLISPSCNSYTNDETPYLDWSIVSGVVQYHLQVSIYSSFSSLIVNAYLGSTSYNCPGLADHLYYWRVQARDQANNWGSWSNIWYFTIDTNPPGSPALLSPTNSSIDSDPTPTLSWTSVSGAVQYNIQVSTTSDFSGLVVDTILSSTSYSVPVLSDDSYYWRVRAKDAAGNWGEWSVVFRFTIDTLSPTITDVQTVPENPEDVDEVKVYCNVSDANGIDQVLLFYRLNGGEWNSLTMVWLFDNLYEVSLGFFQYNDCVEYYIKAYDAAEHPNAAIDDNSGQYYSFTVASGDHSAPTIAAVTNTPTIPNDLETITISCSITDANGIQSATLYYRLNGGSWLSIGLSFVGESTFKAVIGPFDYNVFLEYYLVAVDDSPNHNSATEDNGGNYYQITISASDITPPSITNVDIYPPEPNDAQVVVINCTVIDISGVKNVTLHYRLNGGYWINVSMSSSSSDNYEVLLGPFDYGDVVEFFISAYDNYLLNNKAIEDNGGKNYSFTISSSDFTLPSICDIQVQPGEPVDQQLVTISCNATDVHGIAYVTLYYRQSGGSWFALNMSIIHTDMYSVDIGPFEYGLTIEFYLVAMDASPNHNTVTDDNNGSYYQFFIASSDKTGPTITAVENTENATNTDIINITCQISDLNGVQAVFLYYRINNGSWIGITMQHLTQNLYKLSLGPFETDDFIQYYIEAIDDSPNHNKAIADNNGQYYSFTILPQSSTSVFPLAVIVPLLATFILFVLKRKKN